MKASNKKSPKTTPADVQPYRRAEDNPAISAAVMNVCIASENFGLIGEHAGADSKACYIASQAARTALFATLDALAYRNEVERRIQKRERRDQKRSGL
jgi:hypothetical protein